MPSSYSVAVLPGDGIGPEVTAEAVQVLRAAADGCGFCLDLKSHAIGGHALDEYHTPLPASTLEACQAADAVLLGAIGGPRWDHETGNRRCEAALLALRKELGVFANLRPVQVFAGLASRSPLGANRVSGVDILIVRELTGGIYFGRPNHIRHLNDQRVAKSTMVYSEEEVARIARVAFSWSQRRSGRVTSVDKANVLETSQLWRTVVNEVHASEYSDVSLNHLYIDNAAMQMVLAPKQFDVILAANLFGDILSDLGATLPGSLGMLPSASVGATVGLFEPVHGSAPDIAGQEKANPIGAILSGAMLLDFLGETEAGKRIRTGVDQLLDSGIVTSDLGGSATTTMVGRAISENAFGVQALSIA